jgi:hypothetical protein
MPFRFGKDRVNRYRFQKQHLASPARTKDLPRVIERVGPIRATPATSAYISLWARVAGFRHRHLDAGILEQRSVATIRGMRGKLFLVPVDHLAVYHRLVQSEFRNGLSAVSEEVLELLGHDTAMSSDACEALEQRVLEILSTSGPLTIRELDELLAPACNGSKTSDGCLRIGYKLIPAMEARGLVVRAGSEGGWRSEQYRYAAVSSWLPHLEVAPLSWERAAERAVLAYIRAYGPVTLGDIVFWFGSIPRSEMARLLLGLQNRLWHLEIRGCRGDYVMCRHHLEEMGDIVLESGNVALLPPHDSYPAAYGDMRRFLDHDDRDRVVDRAGEPGGTIWRDGIIIGSWWTKPHQESIYLRFFEDVGADTVALAGERARLLSHFLEYRAPSVDLGMYGEADLAGDELVLDDGVVSITSEL